MYCPRIKMNCSSCIGSYSSDRPCDRTCLVCRSTVDKVSACPLHSERSMCDIVKMKISDMISHKYSEYQTMVNIVNEFGGRLYICIGANQPSFLARLPDRLYYDITGCYNYNDAAIEDTCNIFPWDQYQLMFPRKAGRILQQI